MSQLNKEATRSIAEKTLEVFGIIFILIVFAFILFKGCDSSIPNNDKPDHDTLNEKQNIQSNIFHSTVKENAILKALTDSLMKRKPIYVYRIKTKFDSLYIADTSCQNSLITLYNSFGDLNALNDSIIENSMRRLKNDSIGTVALLNIIKDKHDMRTIDSTYIKRLEDSIPKVKRKSAIRWFFRGAIFGGAIVEGVNIGAKLMP